MGRKTRSIPPAIRRALRLRDGGCRFPGCTHDRYVDGHHVVHWAAGGEVVFKDQRQRPLPTYGLLPTIDPDVLDAWLDKQVLESSAEPEPCAAVWYARDRMNWDLAVGHLFQ